MQSLLTLALLFAHIALGWRPGVTKNIYAYDGTNLFSTKSLAASHRTNSPIPAVPKNSTNPDLIPMRGVNLGSLFVFEPWVAWDEWVTTGCQAYQSELDCGRGLGQAKINAAMQRHWQTYYSEADLVRMVSYGLNTLRIPLGFWMREDLPDRSPDGLNEIFAQGGLAYLRIILSWAKRQGMFVVLDLHGAPGAQQPQQPSTGQYVSYAQFYKPYNFERALKFLEWLTILVHTDPSFASVGAIEVLNEPIQEPDNADVTAMRQSYYPAAVTRIRAVESALKVSTTDRIDIMYMDAAWWSGVPTQYMPFSVSFRSGLAWDVHRYIKWVYGQSQTKPAFMNAACNGDNVMAYDSHYGENPDATIVGEWSLSAPADYATQDNATWNPLASTANQQWYLRWFAAQARTYELSGGGWAYWSWKTDANANHEDPRWSYLGGLSAGIVPRDLGQVYNLAPC